MIAFIIGFLALISILITRHIFKSTFSPLFWSIEDEIFSWIIAVMLGPTVLALVGLILFGIGAALLSAPTTVLGLVLGSGAAAGCFMLYKKGPRNLLSSKKKKELN